MSKTVVHKKYKYTQLIYLNIFLGNVLILDKRNILAHVE